LRLRNLALLPAILTFALTTSTCAQAADRIRIMVGGVEKQIYLPAKLAEQLG
jgi:NitT/TauT family transport system substrate-binding protein